MTLKPDDYSAVTLSPSPPDLSRGYLLPMCANIPPPTGRPEGEGAMESPRCQIRSSIIN